MWVDCCEFGGCCGRKIVRIGLESLVRVDVVDGLALPHVKAAKPQSNIS